MRQGLLGVAIAAFNAERTVVDALSSALACSAVGEVVVVDDGSVDATASIVRVFADQHERVRLFSQENSGTAVARFSAVSQMRSSSVLFLDADDVLCPSGVAELWHAWEHRTSDVAIVGGAARYLSEDGSRIGPPTGQEFSPIDLRSLLTNRYTPWPPASAIVERETASQVLKNLVGDSRAVEFPEDFSFLIGVLEALPGRSGQYLPINVALVRLGRHSKTSGRTDKTFAQAHEIARQHWQARFGDEFPVKYSKHDALVIRYRRRVIMSLVNAERVSAFGAIIMLCIISPRTSLVGLIRRLRRHGDGGR